MLEIISVAPTTVEAAEGIRIDMPCVAYVGVDDGEIVGSGGLAWGSGRCWIWLRVLKSRSEYALPLMRKTRSLLNKAVQLGEREVFTPRDAEYESSERLLTVLGFRLHDIEGGKEVWKWVH